MSVPAEETNTSDARPNRLFRWTWGLAVLLCIAGVYFGFTDLNKSVDAGSENALKTLETLGSTGLYKHTVWLGWIRILFSIASIFALWTIYSQSKIGAKLFASAQFLMVLLPLIFLGFGGSALYYIGFTGGLSFLLALTFLWASKDFRIDL